MNVDIYVNIYVCVCAFMYVLVKGRGTHCKWWVVCIYMYIYVFIYTYVYVCIYTYVYIRLYFDT